MIVIQRAWRAHKARQELLSLTHRKNPPLSVVRKFIHLLDVSASDLDEELRLQVSVIFIYSYTFQASS